MQILHGFNSKMLTGSVGRFDFNLEFPTSIRKLCAGGINKTTEGFDTIIEIGGASLIISAAR